MGGQQAVNLLIDFSIGQSNFHKYYISVSQALTQKDKNILKIMKKFICKYCGKQCTNHSALTSHETFCKSNPNLDDKYKPYEYKGVCQKCGKEFVKVYKNISEFGIYKRKGKLSKFCCRSCANTHVISEETKEKIKIGRKLFDELHPNYWQEIQGEFTKTGKFQKRICKECGKSYVYEKGKGMSKSYCCPECKHEYLSKHTGGYRKGSGHGKSGWYKGIHCDSSWELAFLVYHLDKNLYIERYKGVRKYIFNGVEKEYHPDFITDVGIIEIKGYYTDQVKAKQSQNEDIIIIDKTDIIPYLEYVELHYGKNFTYLYDNSNPNNIDNLNNIWVFKINESKKQYINAFINKNEFDLYLNNGWLNGRINPTDRFKEYKSVRPQRRLFKKLSSEEKEKLFSDIIE